MQFSCPSRKRIIICKNGHLQRMFCVTSIDSRSSSSSSPKSSSPSTFFSSNTCISGQTSSLLHASLQGCIILVNTWPSSLSLSFSLRKIIFADEGDARTREAFQSQILSCIKHSLNWVMIHSCPFKISMLPFFQTHDTHESWQERGDEEMMMAHRESNSIKSLDFMPIFLSEENAFVLREEEVLMPFQSRRVWNEAWKLRNRRANTSSSFWEARLVSWSLFH